jgi:Alanine-zipper, major outer membrane lipoprotein
MVMMALGILGGLAGVGSCLLCRHYALSAERWADEAERRADEAERRADEAESRADEAEHWAHRVKGCGEHCLYCCSCSGCTADRANTLDTPATYEASKRWFSRLTGDD